MGLSSVENLEILQKVKSSLDVTWNDPEADKEIIGYINSSARAINDVAGVELHYGISPTCQISGSKKDSVFYSMCFLGQDLLINRVFYIREKALDDFEKNYRGELTKLFCLGKVYRDVSEEENL